MAAPEGRKPWSVERRSWLVAFGITLFSAMLLHLGHDLDEALWAQALGDLLVGLSLVMVIAGGRGGYGERSTLPLAVGVAILAPEGLTGIVRRPLDRLMAGRGPSPREVGDARA